MVSLIRLKVTYIYLLRKNSIHLEKVTRPCKGINAGGIHIPKSGIKYNQLIIVIRGEPINLVWPPKGFKVTKPFLAMWI
jgi:hypothetical protein